MMILAAWYHSILATLFALLAVMLILIILLQRGKGVGLAGAFGGGGTGTATAFGSKTGDFLTWATIVLAGVFMLFTILLNFIFVPEKATGRLGPAPPPLVLPESEQPIGAGGANGAGDAPVGAAPESPVAPPSDSPSPADPPDGQDPDAADEPSGQPG